MQFVKSIHDIVYPMYHAQVLSKRAASNKLNKLWPNGIVYYDFSPDTTELLQTRIETAIEEYETSTCLDFQRSSEGDYILFMPVARGCSSNSIGKKGGKQVIKLSPNCQRRHGTILHEIGHAIGFWHEQSRPDRDYFVTINTDNIKDGREHNFRKRQTINYQGEIYDYGSVMHYSKRAFSKGSMETISVNDNAGASQAYMNQGSPTLGQRVALSESDLKQVNRLYNCPSPGMRGILNVRMLGGTNLPYEGNEGEPDPHACVEAVDADNNRIKKCTEGSTWSPKGLRLTWEETFEFEAVPSGWRFFEITVLDSEDEKVLPTQTIWVSWGNHEDLNFCFETTCIFYEYLNVEIE